MYNRESLDCDTISYLNRFYEILEEMIIGMTSAKLVDSISHNFIVQMIPHHMAAIEMSKNLLQYTSFTPLENIALNIIKSQTKSIEDMKNALDKCTDLKNSKTDLCSYQRNFIGIIDTMFKQMRNACVSNNINRNFILEMVPHHEGAIRMSRNLLNYDICPELVPIAKAIIKSQSRGVIEMKQLICCT